MNFLHQKQKVLRMGDMPQRAIWDGVGNFGEALNMDPEVTERQGDRAKRNIPIPKPR